MERDPNVHSNSFLVQMYRFLLVNVLVFSCQTRSCLDTCLSGVASSVADSLSLLRILGNHGYVQISMSTYSHLLESEGARERVREREGEGERERGREIK